MKKLVIFNSIFLLLLFAGISFGQTKNQETKLLEQGIELFDANRYQEALGYFEKSLTIARANKNEAVISLNLNYIGLVHYNLGSYGMAISYFDECLRGRTEFRTADEIALILDLMSNSYFRLNDYYGALVFGEKALELLRKLNDKKMLPPTLNRLGLSYDLIGQHDRALEYFEQSVSIAKDLNDEKLIADGLSGLGNAWFSLTQYNNSLHFWGEALKIYKRHKMNDYVVTTLCNIGRNYKTLGEHEKALLYFEEALKVINESHDNKYLQDVTEGIFVTYLDIGKLDGLLSVLEKSLEENRKRNDNINVAISFNNIGYYYILVEQYDKALVYLQEALKISEVQKNKPLTEKVLSNIGSIYLRQKNYKKAEEIFTDKQFNFAPYLVNLYNETHRYSEALKIIGGSIDLPWNMGHSDKIQFHTLKGYALKGSNNLKGATIEFFQAVLLSEEMRRKLKIKNEGFFLGGGFSSRIQPYRGLTATLSERVISGDKADELFKPYGDDLASAAFYFAEATKARALLETLAATGKKSNKSRIPENLRTREERLLSQLAKIDAEWDSAYKQGEKNLKRLQEKKRTYTEELNVLIKQFREKFPRYAAINYPEPITPKGIPLRDNEVLLEYALTDDAGYLFVIRRGQVKKLIKIPVPRESLESEIREFMMPMNNIEYDKFSIKTGRHLYQLLLSEALTEVSPDEKLIIVPDGILGLLPFEALVINEENTIEKSIYVGDRYNISYYPSATVLATQRTLKNSSPEKVLFALGNPVYSNEDPRYLAWKEHKAEPQITKDNKYSFRGLAIKPKWGKTNKSDVGKEIEFPPLPETETEVKEISKIMGGSTLPTDITWLENQDSKVLLSIMANETELKRGGLEKYRYIHFATHASLPGMVQGINEPFILLSQVGNNYSDDGFLTLSEVSNMNLSADLVVLSACVTGVGKEIEGEGVANFARAFQLAGAKSVVVSLWAVASDPAVEFMTKFYGYLKSGKNKGEALNLSRREIKAKYPNPFYWAVFILHGETDLAFYKSTEEKDMLTNQKQPPENVKQTPALGISPQTERLNVPYLTDKSCGNYSNLVVKDTYTRLMWTRNGNLANKFLTFYGANNLIEKMNQEKFAGYDDWRIPTVAELKTFPRIFKCFNSYLYNIQSNYWSSTPTAGLSKEFATVDTLDGYIWYKSEGSATYLWPVRSSKD